MKPASTIHQNISISAAKYAVKNLIDINQENGVSR